jgi:hypothetical protein
MVLSCGRDKGNQEHDTATYKMPCSEYMRLAGFSESKRKAYVYIRLNEEKVGISRDRYEEVVKQAYAALTAAIKDLGWYEMNCGACKTASR